MRKELHFARKFIFGLIFSQVAIQGYSQGPAMSMASSPPVVLTQQVQRLALLDLLKNLEKKHGVIFDYNPKVLENMVMAVNQKDWQNKKLEEILVQLLAPFNLAFKKNNQNSYLIYSKKSEPYPSSNSGWRELPANGGSLTGTPAGATPSGGEGPAGSTAVADRTVSGRVTSSENEEGLPGVSVVLMGTTIGTSTDGEGRFTLTIPDEQSAGTLVFSFIGFVSQEVAIGNKSTIDIQLLPDTKALEEVVVVGYGTQKKSDVTGATERVDAEDFQNQTVTQLTNMLTGTVAGFNVNQSPSAGGVGTMLVRGPTSLTAGTEPMIVVDGAIYKGSLQDINPYDIETIDVLKDASSAAVYGSKAASGVILVTTKKGKTGKPTINFTTRWGMVESTNERRGLGPDEYVQFRKDYFRTTNPNMPYHFYINPNELPDDVSLEEWRELSDSPLEDTEREYLARLRFFPIEVENYLAGRTVDWYDVVMRKGLTQSHDLSIGGGTEDFSYYWSIGHTDNEGIRVGEKYSNVRARLNVDFKITDWLDVGANTQFSVQDESGIPASWNFYGNSPFGREFDEEGNLERMPHGHTDHPLLNYYRQDNLRKTNTLFSNMYANVELPFGIKYTMSFQPRYESGKNFLFTTTNPRVGGVPSQDISQGSRIEYSLHEW